MERKSYIHASFDIISEFVPKIPKFHAVGEDTTIPRICVTRNMYDSLRAAPMSGNVISFCEDIGLPLVVHMYYLLPSDEDSVKDVSFTKDFVPDAEVFEEMWLTKEPALVRRVDYMVGKSRVYQGKDRNGTEIYQVMTSDLKRCRYMDNWELFAENCRLTENAKEHFLNFRKKVTFSSMIYNLMKMEDVSEHLKRISRNAEKKEMAYENQ